MKQKRKGFTLVELIVVIAIIGILAAVLIPTFSGAIESARYANDQAAARNMSTIVKQYCMLNGVDEEDLQAPDIRYIINTSEEFYTFRPSSSEGVFWYNRNTGNVEVTKGVVPSGAALAAEGDFTGDSIEEVLPGQIYLNTEGALANALSKLRNMTSRLDYEQLTETDYANVEGINVSAIAEDYDPATTLFVNSGKGYTEAFSSAIGKVVFADGIQVISGAGWGGLQIEENLTVQLPVTVVLVEQQNPLNDLAGATISTTANNQKVTVVENAFSAVNVSSQLTQTVDAETYASNVKIGNALIKVTSKAEGDETAKEYFLTNGEAADFEESGLQARLTLGNVDNLTGKEGGLVTNANRLGTVVTKALMERFPTIHTLSIVYRPTYNKNGVATMDVQIIALDNNGKVADLVVVAAV